MDNQPSFDRELLLPILLGGFSILGILTILLVGRLNASRASVIVVETETPFKYIYLGTEPVNLTQSPEASGTEMVTDIPLDSPTPRSPNATPALETPALLTPNTTASSDFPPNGGSGPPVSGTLPTNATSASGPPPLNPGTYDDAHPSLGYSPGWVSQGTLHVSQVAGNTVDFRFIGRELRLFYQSNASYGDVTITIDGQDFTLDQSNLQNGNEWVSPLLTNATHTVLITHESGGSVNLDQVVIPVVDATATPTATPTRTPTTTP